MGDDLLQEDKNASCGGVPHLSPITERIPMAGRECLIVLEI
ncbi:hypothetical protein ASZ90_010727 [hydrocarbon metagenome]|uniref:Uncharacterized protein n=1 Tax=hydrocarbon metagenome TaxID=938273 RepID=A0A0W8FF81_9ZZZZ